MGLLSPYPPGSVAISSGNATITASDGAIILLGTALAAPTALAASQSSADIAVTWTDPAAGDVEVWRDGVLLSTVASGVQAYTDTGPHASGTYVYRLRSASGVARSAYTATVSVAYVGIPTLSTSTPNGPAPLSATLSWTEVTGATSYRFQSSVDGFVSTPTNITQATRTFGGTIAVPLAVDFRVRVEAPSVGPWSNVVTVTAS